MAEEFRAAHTELVAIAVDDPGRSEPVRQRLGLSFPILCDQRRELLTAWNMLNEKERGGVAGCAFVSVAWVAVPGVFVIDRERRVTHRWFETTATRVTAASVLATVRGQADAPDRRIKIGLGNMVMAIGNTLRRGGTTPRE